LPIFKEVGVGILNFLLFLGHELEIEVHLVFSWLLDLLNHLGQVHSSQFGQMIAGSVEYQHAWMFLSHLFVFKCPKAILVGRVLLLIEELFCLQSRKVYLQRIEVVC
jgi:hypothetical protein